MANITYPYESLTWASYIIGARTSPMTAWFVPLEHARSIGWNSGISTA